MLALVTDITHGLDSVEGYGRGKGGAIDGTVIRSGIIDCWRVGQGDDLVVIYHFHIFLNASSAWLRVSFVLQISSNHSSQQL